MSLPVADPYLKFLFDERGRTQDEAKRAELLQLITAHASLQAQTAHLQAEAALVQANQQNKRQRVNKPEATSAASPTENSLQSKRDLDDFFRELTPFLMYHYLLLSGRGEKSDDDLVIDSTNFTQLEESAVLSLDRFIKFCEIDNETAAAMQGAEVSMFNIRSLHPPEAQQKEDAIQKHINTRLAFVRGIDTHARTQFDVPLFMLPSGTTQGDGIYISHSARPDCFATQFRGCFEVKSQSKRKALIAQLIQRVAADLTACWLLKRSVAFGYCFNHAFICIGERIVDSDDENVNPYQIKITVFKLTDDKMIDLYWAALTSNKNKFSFLNCDAMPIWRALHRINVNPFLNRIQMAGRSTNRVYTLFFPIIKANKPTYITVPPPVPELVIKVIHGSEAFEHEKSVLEAVRPHWYLGHFSDDNQLLPQLRRPPVPELGPSLKDQVPLPENSWTTPPDVKHSFDGGLIFMKPGIPLADVQEVDKYQVYFDCCRSLQALHAKGYYHCDARAPNICKFGDRFEMIDFGVAHPIAADDKCMKSIRSAKKRPDLPKYLTAEVDDIRKRKLSGSIQMGLDRFVVDERGKVSLEWEMRHDYEMLRHNLDMVIV